MLKYIISCTELLIVAAVLIGMMVGYSASVYGKKGRKITLIGVLAGLVLAVIMSWMKNKTKLIDTGFWNIITFSVILAALIVFLIFDAMKKKREAQSPIVPAALGVISAMMMFYALPDVLAYPYVIVLSGFAVFSTDFIYRFIGIVIGCTIAAVTAVAMYQVMLRLKRSYGALFLKAALILNSTQQVSKVLNLLRSKRIITGKLVFKIVRFTSNHAAWFIYGAMLLAVLAGLFLLTASQKSKETYENSAQHRKVRAKKRSVRRWVTALVVCIVLSLANVTVVKAYANRPVELSAIEECEQKGDELYIPFEQVEDGNLHRFAYTTDNGVAVRFIVIKKPSSSAYGIGLDACDICGETGYYQRGSQVVCNRCDVVMNINTIGFKGGCNPKVIDYRIENGYIIVPTYTLIEHESDFKK